MTQIEPMINRLNQLPVKVGIVGTGYAAKRRAEALEQDQRSSLEWVTGNDPEHLASFCETYRTGAIATVQELVTHPELDLIMICTINRDHGQITQAALEAGKHVVTEYPLALSAAQAEDLIMLSQKRGKLLHVEHIELLGGLHQAIAQSLPAIGKVFYARYTTISPQRPVPRRWTYHKTMFGFPLSAALSRIHRFTDLFGQVISVNCVNRYWDVPETDYFTACLCNARLQFANGLIADIVYGKGDIFWRSDRTFELQGEQGVLLFEGEKGSLIQDQSVIPIEVGSRRGLFAKDTQIVLDFLLEQTPLYITPEQSAYALKVADAAYQSAQTGETVFLV
ncbi:oxidoreductase domain protein [Gloeothece citriformis PCC 7424]|uniref:Oxidoreductase domain protein n=1 Tax=Gloeothece citriformis (strain PCC 7424) TaxID=65393 RepID=B7KC99_GLOC7|nr:Gfo/Idh/MocA family oxidoreductase [Gloeothece citriformis]ACK70204.1 oxidoreductase domain protein [Gloeothece citriformis PCC 7424]